MSNQGNVYLGYNLVLIVQIPAKFLPGEHSTLNRVVEAVVTCHLRARFNKTQDEARSKTITKAVLKHVTIGQWNDRIPEELKKEASSRHAKGTCESPTVGHVYLLLMMTEGDAPRDVTDLHAKLCAADPHVRVEGFFIDSEAAEQLPCIKNPDKHGACAPYYPSDHRRVDRTCADLYPLASRVCGAFVEYKSDLICQSGNPNPQNRQVLGAQDLVKCESGETRVPYPREEVVKKILDVRDAVELICDGLDGSMNYFPPVPRYMQHIFAGRHNSDESVRARYKFPFGVWFRGQSRVCYDLNPSLFREGQQRLVHTGCKKPQSPCVMYDETSMVHHFMLHEPAFRDQSQSLFEWLCLMQHYDAPSRLLDWTEDILSALYFAVWDTSVDCDGAVWVLNAGRLNEITRVSVPRRYACTPSSTDVILRSAMAVSHTGPELKTTLVKHGQLDQIRDAIKEDTFWDWLDGKATTQSSGVWKRLAYPVAVFPTRANDRVASQRGAFTLHGGKVYDEEIESIKVDERFPLPEGLIDISRTTTNEEDGELAPDRDGRRHKRFLDVYVVPSCAKRKLREQLKRLGVHVGSMFPELEYQARYIRHQWRFEPRRSDKPTAANRRV